MSVYSYPQSPVIDEVVFHNTPSGAMRACLHVRDGTDPTLLQPIMDGFHKRCWQAVPISEHGRPELELRGFRNEAQLLKELKNKHWIAGAANIQKNKDDEISFVDKVKKKSLFSSSLLYFLGDWKFFSYGRKSRNALDMAGGVFYAAGSWASFLFARKDNSDLQIEDFSQRMADRINEQAIPLPPEASLANIISDHHKGKIRKADDLLRRFPAELMTSLFGMAGICIATAAYKKLGKPASAEAIEQYFVKQLKAHHAKFPHTELSAVDSAALRVKAHTFVEKMHQSGNKLDIGLGTMTAASGVAAILIPEKVHDPDAPPKHGMNAAWDWVQEHPMSISGIGLMIATMCHAVSTGIEYKVGATSAKSAIMDRGVFVITNLMAELLVAISSKGHGEGVVSDSSVDNSVIAIAADTIARQPVEMQEQMIGYISRFLGRPDMLAMKDEKVVEILHHQVEALRNNPWAQTPATPSVETSAAPATIPFAATTRPWQSKITPVNTASTSPPLQVPA